MAAVAVHAGWSLIGPSRARAASIARWLVYLVAGGIAAATVGPWLVLLLLGCGLFELGLQRAQRVAALLPLATVSSGGLLALSWVALKVGALSYGGGFVIVPLMQADAVHRYHWLTDAQFVNAVALGQITPGPVVHTVAAVGYGAARARRWPARGLQSPSRPRSPSCSQADGASTRSAPTSARGPSSPGRGWR